MAWDFQIGNLPSVNTHSWLNELEQKYRIPFRYSYPDFNYDYDAARIAGAEPNMMDLFDTMYHWPSTFKTDLHPNRFVDGVDTKTGEALFNLFKRNY